MKRDKLTDKLKRYNLETLYYDYYKDNLAACPEAEVYLANMTRGLSDNKDIYIELPYCGYSDYSGCIVERANYKFIEDNEDDIQETLPPILLGYGGYGTRVVYVNVSAGTKKQRKALFETIDNLQSYPCFDDEMVSNLEMEVIEHDIIETLGYEVYRILEDQDIFIETLHDDLAELVYSDNEYPYIELGHMVVYPHDAQWYANSIMETL